MRVHNNTGSRAFLLGLLEVLHDERRTIAQHHVQEAVDAIRNAMMVCGGDTPHLLEALAQFTVQCVPSAEPSDLAKNACIAHRFLDEFLCLMIKDNQPESIVELVSTAKHAVSDTIVALCRLGCVDQCSQVEFRNNLKEAFGLPQDKELPKDILSQMLLAYHKNPDDSTGCGFPSNNSCGRLGPRLKRKDKCDTCDKGVQAATGDTPNGQPQEAAEPHKRHGQPRAAEWWPAPWQHWGHTGDDTRKRKSQPQAATGGMPPKEVNDQSGGGHKETRTNVPKRMLFNCRIGKYGESIRANAAQEAAAAAPPYCIDAADAMPGDADAGATCAAAALPGEATQLPIMPGRMATILEEYGPPIHMTTAAITSPPYGIQAQSDDQPHAVNTGHSQPTGTVRVAEPRSMWWPDDPAFQWTQLGYQNPIVCVGRSPPWTICHVMYCGYPVPAVCNHQF